MWLEIYQTVGATAGIVALVCVTAMMSWRGKVQIALAGLFCVFAAWESSVDRDVRRADETLISKTQSGVADDPECKTVVLAIVGIPGTWQAIVCPKNQGMPL